MMDMIAKPPMFEGAAVIVQGVLPDYRAPLFDDVARRCTKGLSVLAGFHGKGLAVKTVDSLEIAKFVRVRNVRLFPPPLVVTWQIGMMARFRDLDPDVLVVLADARLLTTRLAIRWMRKRGRPVIGWGLGTMEVRRGLSPLRKIWRNRFLRRFDRMIAYSSRAADEYAAVGIPRDRIWVAANATTRRPSGPPPARPENFDEPATVLFVGRLIAWKRVDLLIEACAKLPESLQPRLRIVGDGPVRTGLEEMAKEVYPRAVFTGGLFGEELAPEFNAADLLVLPGMGGLAIQQAMAHALPVIVAEGDGTQSDLIRPESGWNVTPDNSDALAELMSEALANRPRLRKMGTHAYRIVAEEINIETMADVFVEAMRCATGQA